MNSKELSLEEFIRIDDELTEKLRQKHEPLQITDERLREIAEQIDNADCCHFRRVCNECGNVWWSLHCEHDGRQKPCANGHYNKPSTTECECEFDYSEAVAILRKLIDEVK